MKPEYLTKQLAAQHLGLSVRRVLELSNSGKLRRKRVIDPATQRKQTVLLAVDVARMAAANKTAKALQAAPAGATDMRLARPDLALPPTEPAAPRLWLTAAEAADYSGLPASFLVHAIDTGVLLALDVGVRPGGKYRIRKTDIEALTGRKFGEELGNKKRSPR